MNQEGGTASRSGQGVLSKNAYDSVRQILDAGRHQSERGVMSNSVLGAESEESRSPDNPESTQAQQPAGGLGCVFYYGYRTDNKKLRK